MTSAADALARLKAGNLRFAAGKAELDVSLSTRRRDQLVSGQNPFAVILGASHSRVPVEMIFDQGLGDLVISQAIRANIRASVEQLQHGSALVEELVRNEGLVVVGAEPSLQTGQVEHVGDLAGPSGTQ